MKISDEELEYIDNYALSQREWNLDTEIKNQCSKWDDDTYYFDESECRKFVLFVSKLQLDKGKKGQFISLLKFQFEILTDILCVKNRETNFRRFTKCFLDIGRKNGKGTIVALAEIYLYFTSSVYGGEYILVANTAKQAANLFTTIKLMIQNNDTLKKHCKIRDSYKEITRTKNNSRLIVLANDGKNADSYATYFLVCDEVHEYRSMEVYEKLKTGMGLWDDALCFITTTASNGQDPFNFEQSFYDLSKKMENGEVEKDETFYCKIYEAKKKCDLFDVQGWIDANPAIGNFRKIKDIHDYMVDATNMKSLESKARRLYLNQHISIGIENAIDIEAFDDCMQKVSLEDLRGMTCWAALDMSALLDITAYVQVFYDEARDKYIIYPHLFTPKDTLRERSERDGIRYDLYVNNGNLHALNGRFINTEELNEYIVKLNEDYEFDTEELAFDKWGAIGIADKLDENFVIFPFGQTYKEYSPVIKDFEILLLERKLIIADNQMLRWMATNVVAVENCNGDIRYDKSKSKNKIDGIIAMLMALARARYATGGGYYNAVETLENMDW